MSAANQPSFEMPSSTSFEILPNAPEVLMEYIRTQFDAAYRDEAFDLDNERAVDNGTFYKQMHVVDDHHHELEESSVRIILAPPLNVSRIEQPREYFEVFAIFLRGVDGHMVGDTSGYFADQYLVRAFTNGHTQPYKLVTAEGVFSADVDEFDIVAGFSVLTQQPQSLEAELAEAAAPLLDAQRLYDTLSRCNIVASTD